ncbi:ogr/Delta-like zinc finger family protein [Comamonas thiooxydans]|uniref:ogr/Delta-like zinc finger family protein n=1 Tax=Comamonas thiooxydans TaxID=363952 RepID=UPI0018D3F5F5|nr:ogr/Delta-like zinc finger family protein [Comamonas thiooxydans]
MDQLSKEFVDPGGRRLMFNCPHCGAKSHSRTSRFVTDLVRDVVFVCTDIECGHTFMAQLAAVRTISPSSKPREGIFLPMSALKQKLIRDQVSLNKQDGGAYSTVLCKSAEYKKSESKPKAHFEIPAQDPIISALHGAPAAS